MLTSTLENLLNRGLPRSPRARQLCRELQGHRVGVEVTGFTRWVVESNGDTLHLTRDSATAAEAELAGGPLSLMALMGEAPEDILQRGDVQIRGDAELAQKFRELAMLLRPDVEEELSKLIGDTPAHQALRLARAVTGFGRRAVNTGVRNVAEYLAHERGDLVPRAEAEDFYRGVERLREDLDRLDARTRLLEQPDNPPDER
jgi:ubiquinone biosynthesis accessory factor UbiJ